LLIFIFLIAIYDLYIKHYQASVLSLNLLVWANSLIWMLVKYSIKPCLFAAISRVKTNIQYAWIFARVHNYSNTMKVFGYTRSKLGVLILAYLVMIYIFKVILVFHWITLYVVSLNPLYVCKIELVDYLLGLAFKLFMIKF